MGPELHRTQEECPGERLPTVFLASPQDLRSRQSSFLQHLQLFRRPFPVKIWAAQENSEMT